MMLRKLMYLFPFMFGHPIKGGYTFCLGLPEGGGKCNLGEVLRLTPPVMNAIKSEEGKS